LDISGIRVERRERCVVIRMERGENRLNREFMGAMNQALDAAERYVP
jgi:enoyl-CoA hydratase/carnithine racemase